jgi:hypothetical protein
MAAVDVTGTYLLFLARVRQVCHQHVAALTIAGVWTKITGGTVLLHAASSPREEFVVKEELHEAVRFLSNN